MFDSYSVLFGTVLCVCISFSERVVLLYYSFVSGLVLLLRQSTFVPFCTPGRPSSVTLLAPTLLQTVERVIPGRVPSGFPLTPLVCFGEPIDNSLQQAFSINVD